MALAVVLVAALAGCDQQQRSDPRLLVEQKAQKWVVVQVHDRTYGDCLELRSEGVPIDRTCDTASLMAQFTVGVSVPRGSGRPIVFGMLPEGTAKAEIAQDGGTYVRRDPKRVMLPVEVRTFGDAGRFVAEPAPGERWKDNATVNVEAYDAQGNRIAPPR